MQLIYRKPTVESILTVKANLQQDVFNNLLHPRQAAGTEHGGEFAKKIELPAPSKPGRKETYSEAVAQNMQHLGTSVGQWHAVGIKKMSETKDEAGEVVKMPEFDFPQGYDRAPTLYEQTSGGNTCCELCGHTPIKNCYWIQNDEKKWTMLVGSECITNFQESSGDRMAKEVQWKENRDFLREVIDARLKLRTEFRHRVSVGYGRTEIKWVMGAIVYDNETPDAYKIDLKLERIIGKMRADDGALGEKASTNGAVQGWVTRNGKEAKEVLAELDAWRKRPGIANLAINNLSRKANELKGNLMRGDVGGRKIQDTERAHLEKSIAKYESRIAELKAVATPTTQAHEALGELRDILKAVDAEIESRSIQAKTPLGHPFWGNQWTHHATDAENDTPGTPAGKLRHAVLVIGGKRYRGMSHFQAYMDYMNRTGEQAEGGMKEGFETESGHFLNREQAAQYVGKTGELHSEEVIQHGQYSPFSVTAVDGKLHTAEDLKLGNWIKAAESEVGTDLFAFHDAARREGERVYSQALHKFISAAEAEAARKKKRKQDRRTAEELFLLFLLYFELASEEAYGVVSNRLAPGLAPAPGTGATFAAGRQQYLKAFPERVVERLTKKAEEAREQGLSEKEVLRKVQQEGEDIEEGEGKVLVETEGQATYGSAQIRILKQAGFATKVWNTVGDERVRESHVLCEAQGEVPIDKPFQNGLQYPGDPNGGPEEVMNCRCWLTGGRRARVTASQQTVHPYWRHGKEGMEFVGQYEREVNPASGVTIEQKEYNQSNRMMARSVSGYFHTDITCKVVKVVPFDSLGTFEAGGKQFVKGGHFDKSIGEVVSVPSAGVMAHEFGHAEFDWAKDEAVNGLHEAVERWQKENPGKSVWKTYSDTPDWLLRPDGSLKNPKTARERLYNAILAFRWEHGKEDKMPTDYARSWFKEPIVDGPYKKVTVNEGGRDIDLAVEITTHRSISESFAEYSSGKVQQKMVKDGLIESWEVTKDFRGMDGPEGRKAFLDLQKAIDEAVKEFHAKKA